MLGKTPAYIQTHRPLAKGIISDFEIAEKMLKFYFDRINHDSFAFLARPSVVIGVPLDITEVEKKAVEDACISAGAREVVLVNSIIAAAIGARLPIQDASGSMIVSLGGGLVEMGVVSLSGVVNWNSLSVAGLELDKNIIQYARDQFNLLLGERVAEEIKIKIGSAENTEEDLQIEMRGRDLISGLPRELFVNAAQIREAIAPSIRAVVDMIKVTLEQTPPEIVADIYERGMVLSGGGALLRGLDHIIVKATQIPVRVAEDPLTCTIRGIGILLEDENLRNDVKVPLSHEEYKIL
jgi:rod shape-determining protein MreB